MRRTKPYRSHGYVQSCSVLGYFCKFVSKYLRPLQSKLFAEFCLKPLSGMVCLLMIPIGCLASTKAAVGYGSSDAVLPAKNQELFLMGFELGLEKKLKHRKASELFVLDQTSDGSPLGAIGSARRLLDKDVSLLVGFPTSQEALLAAKLAKAKDVLSISAAGGHADLGKMGPTVFTLGESMDYSVNETQKFIGKIFGKRRGLLITNPYAVFSKNQEDIFLKQLAEKNGTYLNVNLAAIHLKKDLTLADTDIESLKRRQFDYIVLTTYASESAKLLEQLEKSKIDTPLVLNSSWTMGDVDFGRRFLTSRKSPTYVAGDWAQTSEFTPAFEKLVKGKYGRSPTAEIAAGYDLGVIVAKIVNPIHGTISKEAVLKEFITQSCFDELSGSRVCFDKSGGHAIREISFRQFTARGLIPIEPVVVR